MPITDAAKKQIAQQRRLFLRCVLNAVEGIQYLHLDAESVGVVSVRLKNRTLGAKK